MASNLPINSLPLKFVFLIRLLKWSNQVPAVISGVLLLSVLLAISSNKDQYVLGLFSSKESNWSIIFLWYSLILDFSIFLYVFRVLNNAPLTCGSLGYLSKRLLFYQGSFSKRKVKSYHLAFFGVLSFVLNRVLVRAISAAPQRTEFKSFARFSILFS